LGDRLDEIGVYAVSGDGSAVNIHLGHSRNPAILFHSICIIDGDSRQLENTANRIYRLPGEMPELTVYNAVVGNLDRNLALLTVACQRSVDKQEQVGREIRDVQHTNRDPHVIFSQVGARIGFVSESIVRGAFLSVWVQENPGIVREIAKWAMDALNLPPKQNS
jgi:hypothetical protein